MEFKFFKDLSQNSSIIPGVFRTIKIQVQFPFFKDAVHPLKCHLNYQIFILSNNQICEITSALRQWYDYKYSHVSFEVVKKLLWYKTEVIKLITS